MLNRFIKHLRFLSLLLILQGGSFSLQADDTPPATAVRLVHSMVERLKISREVAWTKYKKHLKINDPAREAAILASLQSQGRKIGLSDSTVACFFKSQFMASKKVQEELVNGWQSGRPLPTTPPKDLQKEIRPIVDMISRAILVELKATLPQSFTPEFRCYAEKEIHAQGFSWEVAEIAVSCNDFVTNKTLR
jgi:chorismate mutase